MALDYEAIENAIVAVFAADDWLKIVAGNVKIIDARVREAATTETEETYGLARDTELPGIIVTARSARREPVTCGEHDNFIPIDVLAIVSELERTTARATLTTLVENLERVIEKQVTSAQAWGIAATTVIPSIQTNIERFPDGDNHIGRATITFDVLKITSIEGV